VFRDIIFYRIATRQVVSELFQKGIFFEKIFPVKTPEKVWVNTVFKMTVLQRNTAVILQKMISNAFYANPVYLTIEENSIIEINFIFKYQCFPIVKSHNVPIEQIANQ